MNSLLCSMVVNQQPHTRSAATITQVARDRSRGLVTGSFVPPARQRCSGLRNYLLEKSAAPTTPAIVRDELHHIVRRQLNHLADRPDVVQFAAGCPVFAKCIDLSGPRCTVTP
jgi:hypothetical protein